jgi:putative lipoic acid-binding regulatory protein
MEPNSNPDNLPPADLLESTHTFPGTYRIKAIGQASDDFESRIVSAARAHLTAESDLEHSVRASAGGRHVAITLELTVRTAEQVRMIYAELGKVEGLALLI